MALIFSFLSVLSATCGYTPKPEKTFNKPKIMKIRKT